MSRFPVCALRSVELGTPDLAVSERFYTEVWGLDVVARQQGVLYLRATGSDHHVLALHPSDKSERLPLALRAASVEDLAALPRAAEACGATILSGPAPNDGPEGGMAVAILDPQGATLRFVCGDMRHAY